MKWKNIKWEKHHLWIKILLIMFIPLSIYLGVTNYLLYDESAYKDEFEKVGTYDRVPEADSILDNLLKFFKGEKEIDANFTYSEIIHLSDVRNLIGFLTKFFYILVLIKLILFGAIIFTSKKAIDDLIHITMGSGTLTIMWPIMLLNFNFDYLFTEFHKLFFPQGGWIFPESSLLIQLFPEMFFENFLANVIHNAMFVGGCLISFSIVLWLVTRKE